MPWARLWVESRSRGPVWSETEGIPSASHLGGLTARRADSGAFKTTCRKFPELGGEGNLVRKSEKEERKRERENLRTDVFELWYWRRLLRVPWTARRSNQSILKEINPEYSLEELMLKLKLQ